MADSRIPLGINQLDITQPLAVRRQGELQQYEMQRQQGIDSLNQQQAAQSQELGGLQIEQIKKQIAQLPPEQLKLGMQQITTDTFALQSLLKKGDTEAAMLVANGLKQTGAKLGMPTEPMDNFIRLMGSNPQAATQYLDVQVEKMKANLPATFADVQDASGNIVGQRNSQTNRLESTPDALNPNAASAAAQQQFGGQIQLQDEQGNLFFATTARNPRTGAADTVLSPIGNDPNLKPVGRVQMVGNYGETGEQRTGRAVAEATGTTAAREEEQRASTIIDRATAAAESTGVIRRALTLLDTVETGGPEAIALSVRQSLGIEGADEGELSNSLGKAVLSQLRETFGAAFTQTEGERLGRIEAAFNKSPANNKRLLQQVLRIAENTAKRGINLAQARGQKETVDDLSDLLTFSLDVEGTAPAAGAGSVGRFKIEVVE